MGPNFVYFMVIFKSYNHTRRRVSKNLVVIHRIGRIFACDLVILDYKRRMHCSWVHVFHSRRGSSVVERVIGNDEVGSSILPRGTI